jgi:hypothetical protein
LQRSKKRKVISCFLYNCFLYNLFYDFNIILETSQKKAALRRQKKPHLPWNPTNPYDSPLLSSDVQERELEDLDHPNLSSTQDDDNTSVDSRSTYATHMLTPSQASTSQMPPPSQRSGQSKRRRNPDSVDLTEADTRIVHMQQQVLVLQRRKQELELRKEQNRLQREIAELESEGGG